MADDKHYRGGDYYQIDDFRGYKVRASRTRKQWDGLITLPSSYSPRQPQDLVIGVRDDQFVPQPRSRQTNQFVIVATYVTRAGGASANPFSIFVASTVGFNVGDPIQIMLDQGVPFYTTISAIVGDSISWTGQRLPGTVGGNFGDPIENSVVNLATGDEVPPGVLSNQLGDGQGNVVGDGRGGIIGVGFS